MMMFLQAVQNQIPDEENLILNPTTPQSLLAILTRAADGRTRSELCRVTNFQDEQQLEDVFRGIATPQDKSNKNELSLATAILLNKGVNLHPQFQRSTDNNTLIASLDFTKEKSIRTVNQWASDASKGTIKQILSPTGQYADLKILLASAVYFRGSWREAFKPAGDKSFNSLKKGELFQVPFMTLQRNFRYGEVDNNNKEHIFSWVELPYSDDRFSMIIVKPENGVTLQTVIEQFDIEKFIKLEIRVGLTEVNITMPKFQLRSSTSLVAPLQSMGVVSIFNQGAELPHLIASDKAVVSNMIQDSFIDVDLEGSRASAVTTVNVITLSASYPEDTIQFFVDKPFLAIILEKTQNIPLFYAKVTRPGVTN